VLTAVQRSAVFAETAKLLAAVRQITQPRK
jgi:hypothetical protein